MHGSQPLPQQASKSGGGGGSGMGSGSSVTLGIVDAAMMAVMYAIKTAIAHPRAAHFDFLAQKTMYGGKRIAVGDVVYLFASENAGGAGLVARGVVTAAEAVPRAKDVERQTPRVNLTVERTGLATRRLGRTELRAFADWDDGRPQTELNFKFYRQATDKVVGLTAETAAFLSGFF